MSRQYFQNLTAVFLCLVLAACGGGGGGGEDDTLSRTETDSGTNSGANGTNGNGSANPDGGTSSPPAGDSGGSPPPPSPGDSSGGNTGGNTGSPTEPPAPATFAARIVTAPPDRAFLGSSPYEVPVAFVVEGSGLENVELVSAAGDQNKYGTFTISSDKTRATLEWNPYQWMYGSYDLKVVAWNVPAGQSGQRIEAMDSRHYIIKLPLGCYPACGGEAP